MIVSRLPTYSFYDVKNLIRSLNVNELAILQDVFCEEENNYPPYEARAVWRLIRLQQKCFSRNELQFEFLLAYN